MSDAVPPAMPAAFSDPDHLTGADLPLRTPDLPGIGGRIRTRPQDFRVVEIPAYDPAGEGPHLYLNLSRASLTTPDVATLLSRCLDVPAAAIGYAGLKDRHAQVTQTFSVAVGLDFSPDENELRARIETAGPVQVHWMARHTNKLRQGHLHGNRFEILIREPALPLPDATAGAERIAARLRTRGMANFFGPQRFSRGGGNVRRGWQIVHEGWRERRRWLHRLYLSAYQSHLCNQYLALRQGEGALDAMVLGDVARKRETGGMFTVTEPEVDTNRLQADEISFTAPMFGHKMWEATACAGEWENRILAQAGLRRRDWKRHRVPGTRRTGRLLVPDLTVTLDPEGVRLAFALPKGGFATTVLREIMKDTGSTDTEE